MNKVILFSLAVAFVLPIQVVSNNMNSWRPTENQIRAAVSGHVIEDTQETWEWLELNALADLPLLVRIMDRNQDNSVGAGIARVVLNAANKDDPGHVIENLLEMSSSPLVRLCAGLIAADNSLMTDKLREMVLVYLNPEYDNTMYVQLWALHILKKAGADDPAPVMELIRRSPSPARILRAGRTLLEMTEGEMPDAWKKEITDRLFDFLLNASPDGVQHKNGAAELLAQLGDRSVLNRWADELPKIREAERQRTQEDMRLLLSLTESQIFDEQMQSYFDQELEETTIYRRIEAQYRELKQRLDATDQRSRGGRK